MSLPAAIAKRAFMKLIGLGFVLQLSTSLAAGPTVAILTNDHPAKPVEHGLSKLKAALQQNGTSVEEVGSLEEARSDRIVVAAIVNGQSEITHLLSEVKIAPPNNPESLLIRHFNRDGKPIVLVAGADAHGLMYGLMDVAERVGWAASRENAFSK